MTTPQEKLKKIIAEWEEENINREDSLSRDILTFESWLKYIKYPELIAGHYGKLTMECSFETVKECKQAIQQLLNPQDNEFSILDKVNKHLLSKGINTPEQLESKLEEIGVIEKEDSVEEIAKKHVDTIMFQEPDLRMQAYNSFIAGYNYCKQTK